MKIGGGWASIERTCIGEVWVRRTTSSGPGGSSSPFERDPQVGAQGRRIDVEGVLCHPRRVARRVVERGEVVVVELDLGSLDHPVSEADEDVLDLALGADQRVERPGGDAAASPAA